MTIEVAPALQREDRSEWRREVTLRLAGDPRVFVRQTLYQEVHRLETLARAASPRGSRRCALVTRADTLRQVAEQLA
jgi:hypothetical protein